MGERGGVRRQAREIVGVGSPRPGGAVKVLGSAVSRARPLYGERSPSSLAAAGQGQEEQRRLQCLGGRRQPGPA